MDKIKEIRNVLLCLDMPKRQQSDLCVLTLLGMAGLTKKAKWEEAVNKWMRIHDIIAFVNKYYKTSYAENSRETFRKQALHHFRLAALAEDNGMPTNSPNYRWRLTDEFVEILQSAPFPNDKLTSFVERHGTLKDLYASKKRMHTMPVCINQKDYVFSSGKHNELQKAILEEFAPRFAPESECLYVGDTVQKDLVRQEDTLKELGFDISVHDKMPDVILYRRDKNWLYFIEAVTSVGPIDAKRILEIKEMTSSVSSGLIFVTAFFDFKTYKRFSDQLAWETEVWLAEMPDHMIHLNGDKFLGPR